MKRLNSSDSLGALMTICPNSPDDEVGVNNPKETNAMYMIEHEFHNQAMMDGDCVEESLGQGHHHVSEKKRRLSNEQVKALEKNFDVENKLEPERKVKLALELGLQPRQVAVWFQNRRARWKTKNLERDYGALKSNYDALENDFETLQRDNESLLKEIQELKSKLASVKQEPFVSEAANDDEGGKHEEDEAIHVSFLTKTTDQSDTNEHLVLYDSKDHGSSDSDSSALLNDDDNNNYGGPALDLSNMLEIHNNNGSSSSSSSVKSASEISNSLEDSKRAYQPQFVKIEEHDFSTSFFDDEQAPTLNWYDDPDEWD